MKDYTTLKVKFICTNNARKMAGLPMYRKSSKGKRYKTRCEVMEAVSAFIEYCNS